MDLALALVEDDLGRDIAHALAQELVLSCTVRAASRSSACRNGRRSQPPTRSVPLCRRSTPIPALAMAHRSGEPGRSPRYLQRRFTAELGISPAAYVEWVRIEAAQRALAQASDLRRKPCKPSATSP